MVALQRISKLSTPGVHNCDGSLQSGASDVMQFYNEDETHTCNVLFALSLLT